MSNTIEFVKGAPPPPKFCASPWVEGVLAMNGAFKPCCKNMTVLGVWRKDGVANSWNSKRYKAFRGDIVIGKYPDVYCETCCLNGSSQSLRQLLQKPLQDYATALRDVHSAGIYNVARLRDILDKRDESDETKDVLAKYYAHLKRCGFLIKLKVLPKSARLTVSKLKMIGQIVEDFLRGNVAPEIVAPLRQASLIAVCNARCIHCPGLYTKSITEGVLIPGGARFKEMSENDVDMCFEEESHIIDFFMNGSEILFSKTWPIIAERLKEQGVKARVSTNGMLLTERNAQTLIDNGYLGKLNLSLDGGTKETIELIRERVDFDRVVKNLTFLLEYAAEKDYIFTFSITFVLMDLNYRELADFVKLAEQFHKINPKIKPSIMVQPLARKGVKGYADFVAEHHPALVDHDEIKASFQKMQEQSLASEIPVFVFFTWTLEDFIKKGCPIPPSDVIVTSDKDEELE